MLTALSEPGTMDKTNIIIADRDIALSRDLAGIVEGMGCRAFLAHCLDDVFAHFQKRSVGMLIVDTSVLEETRFELIDILRGFQRDFPIVVTTGTPSEELEREIRIWGVIFYAPKPVDEDWIKEIVRRSLSRKVVQESRA
jgi:DNA-binding NtrC family response regulator